jgi:histone H1/5
MYKQQPKSPMLKALKGNQSKLPQHLQEAIKAAPESPAKAITGPGVQKEAGKTGTGGANSAKGINAASAPVQGPPRKTSNTLSKSVKNRSYAPDTFEGKVQSTFSTPKPKAKASAAPAPKAKAPAATAPKAKAKPKYDKELNSLVASRKGLKKGTAEYNRVQNRINEKLGSSVRRATEETTKLAPKKPATASTAASKVASSRGLTPQPAAKKPAAKKAPSQADKFENALAKESAKAPMGSETRSKAPAAKKPAAKKPVAKKPAAKKTVGQKVKGTVRNARLAQLDRKANRQEARAENKTARKTKRAAKLTARANKLTGK